MRDLIEMARGLAAQKTQRMTVIALYGPPQCLRWGVEHFSNLATGSRLKPAAAALLNVGLSALLGSPGVKDICEARKTLLPIGDPETMHWLDHFPLFAVSAMRTDNARSYRLHVAKDLYKRIAKLAIPRIAR